MNKIKFVAVAVVTCVYAVASYHIGLAFGPPWPLGTFMGALLLAVGLVPVVVIAAVAYCIYDFIFGE